MKVKFISTVLMLCFSFSFGESRQQKLLRLKKESNDNYKYLGQLSKNSFSTDSTSNKYGRYGSKYSTDSINNKYGNYGSKYSPNSVNNPYAIDTPKLYDSQGNYRGKLSSNKYDPESISNPYGIYGNKYGVNNPYSLDSPNNEFGEGLTIVAEEKTKSNGYFKGGFNSQKKTNGNSLNKGFNSKPKENSYFNSGFNSKPRTNSNSFNNGGSSFQTLPSLPSLPTLPTFP